MKTLLRIAIALEKIAQEIRDMRREQTARFEKAAQEHDGMKEKAQAVFDTMVQRISLQGDMKHELRD